MIELYLAEQIYELTQLMHRDELRNSLGHLQKIEQRSLVLIALLKGEKPELPI